MRFREFLLHHVFIAVLVLVGSVLLAFALQVDKPASARPANGERTPVLVELFTSEGCSSCPVVDGIAASLQQKQPIANAQVVLLSFHVDYWDRLGWKDRFSSHDFTLRQQRYSSWFSEDQVYTPEVVVNGRETRAEFLDKEIRNATSDAKPVAVTIKPKSPSVVTISATSDAKTNAGLFVAIAEDDLTTTVRGGENGGRTLKHSGVVRKFVPLGKLEKGALTKEFAVPSDPQWQSAKLMLVCFAPDEKSGRILGVNAQPLAQLVK